MPARVLIVEDNPTNLQLMSYLLTAFGYSHTVARDGVEAVEVARRERPDLIICDIQLPRMDGYQVVATLKRDPSFKATPMIAVTALAMVGDRDKVLASGFNGYLAKPIQPDTFVAQVERFLDPLLRSSSLPHQVSAKDDESRPVCKQHRGVILVVDDSAENRELAFALLDSSGYRVITAEGQSSAMELARRSKPDFVLSDFHFGDGTGLDLLDRFRSESTLSGIPFAIISSSLPNLEERARAEQQGIKVILRPIDSERLLAEIETRWAAAGLNTRQEKDNGDDR